MSSSDFSIFKTITVLLITLTLIISFENQVTATSTTGRDVALAPRVLPIAVINSGPRTGKTPPPGNNNPNNPKKHKDSDPPEIETGEGDHDAELPEPGDGGDIDTGDGGDDSNANTPDNCNCDRVCPGVAQTNCVHIATRPPGPRFWTCCPAKAGMVADVDGNCCFKRQLSKKKRCKRVDMNCPPKNKGL